MSRCNSSGCGVLVSSTLSISVTDAPGLPHALSFKQGESLERSPCDNVAIAASILGLYGSAGSSSAQHIAGAHAHLGVLEELLEHATLPKALQEKGGVQITTPNTSEIHVCSGERHAPKSPGKSRLRPVSSRHQSQRPWQAEAAEGGLVEGRQLPNRKHAPWENSKNNCTSLD